MDYDHDNRKMLPGSTRENWNTRLHSSVGSNKGIIENIMGNVEVPNPLLPNTGTNQILGAYEDELNNTIFAFYANTGGKDCIFRYFPDRVPADRWELVRQYDFNFDPNHFILDIDLIGDLLYFHDDINPPRKINVVKSNDTNKRFIFNLYFGDGKTNVFLAGTTWGWTYTDYNGNIFNLGLLYVSLGVATFADGISAFAESLRLNLGSSYTITSNGSFVTVEMPGPVLDISALSSSGDMWLVLQNAYDYPFSDIHIDVIKYPPRFPIKPTPRYDNTVPTNNIQGLPFQFRYQYIYDDNEFTVYSTISVVALDPTNAQVDMFQTLDNCIDLDYSDGGNLLTDPYRNAIKKVVLAFRIGNTGNWKQIITLEQFELTGLYTFYNNGIAAPITDADAAEPFHSVPLLAGNQEVAKDRLYYGDTTEGYDEVNIDMDFDIEVRDSPDQDTWNIIGYLVIESALNNGGNYDSVFSPDGDPSTFLYGGYAVTGNN